MFKLFFKKKGCLHGKNQEEKNKFFESLVEYSKSAPDYFEQQHDELLPHEKNEFFEWIKKRNENLLLMKSLVTILGELLEEKYPKKNQVI